MKKTYFIIGLAMLMLFSIAVISYGAYLNERGELQIARRLEERSVHVAGERAAVRVLHPKIRLETLNLYSNEMVDAVTLIDGRITESFVEKNSYVHAGDPLFTIVNESIPIRLKEAESNLLKAQAALRHAKITYERYQRLRNQNATSEEKYDAAAAEYESALASVEEMEARKKQILIQDAQQQVTAPVDGKVILMYRQPGAFVQAGTSLALVGDFRQLYFTMSTSDDAAEFFQVGQNAELVFQGKELRKVFASEMHVGAMDSRHSIPVTIASISPDLSESAKIRTVLCRVDNSQGILEPQTYGGVDLQLSDGREALVVPVAALGTVWDGALFVVKDGTVERREVKTGQNDGEYVEILSGVSAGEVVVSTPEGLHDGMRVSVVLKER